MVRKNDFIRLLRIFGTPEAYEASLPERHWVKGKKGFVTHQRGMCADCARPKLGTVKTA